MTWTKRPMAFFLAVGSQGTLKETGTMNLRETEYPTVNNDGRHGLRNAETPPIQPVTTMMYHEPLRNRKRGGGR